MEELLSKVAADRIYQTTGIQFLPFNTLYQLYAASRQTPRLLAAADSLVTVPDLFKYWMTGELATEYTNASTTQFLDARSRSWATGLLEALEIPARLLTRIVAPGTILGSLQIRSPHTGTPVVLPACHDTGRDYSYEELLDGAASDRQRFDTLIDPDHPTFLSPASMAAAIAEFCRKTGQPGPGTAAAYARTILVSLAMKYRFVLEWLEELTGEALRGDTGHRGRREKPSPQSVHGKCNRTDRSRRTSGSDGAR